MRNIAIAAFLAGLFAFGNAVTPAMGNKGPESNSAKAFVNRFYKWYLAQASDQNKAPLQIALTSKKKNFSYPLWHALELDERANTRSKDGIVGLDFDPILNSQDPDTEYWVDHVKQQGGSYFATVFARSKDRPTSLRVTAIVKRVSGGWQFTNFRYEDGSNLLSVLKQLRKERGEKY